MVVQNNAPNVSTSPPNITTAKPAPTKEPSANSLSQQIRSLNEVVLRLATRKKGSNDDAEYTSPLELKEDLPDKTKSFPACQVPFFRRSADSNFTSWLFQIEAFFQFCAIPERNRVTTLTCRIHHIHFEEIQPYMDRVYPAFVKELRQIFKSPDLTQVRLLQLSNVY